MRFDQVKKVPATPGACQTLVAPPGPSAVTHTPAQEFLAITPCQVQDCRGLQPMQHLCVHPHHPAVTTSPAPVAVHCCIMDLTVLRRRHPVYTPRLQVLLASCPALLRASVHHFFEHQYCSACDYCGDALAFSWAEGRGLEPLCPRTFWAVFAPKSWRTPSVTCTRQSEWATALRMASRTRPARFEGLNLVPPILEVVPSSLTVALGTLCQLKGAH